MFRGGGGRETSSQWLIAKDNLFYSSYSLKKLSEKTLSNIVVFPNLEEIRYFLRKKENYTFISPYGCPKEFSDVISTIKLPNFYGILTSQEARLGITKAQALQEKLGISVIDSPFTMTDIEGADELKKYIKELQIAEKQGYKSKGIFLIGIPGTGKTFFPTCLAGELKRPLVMLNLEQLKETGSPINKINEVFEFLNNEDEPVILLIDEIEKMVGNADDPLTGRLMTILSSLGDKGSEYPNLNLLVFATANNLESILKNQPALLRRGRFDELFFVNLPDLNSAKSIFAMYIKKYDLNSIYQITDIDELLAEIEAIYRDDNPQANKFCYTPSEIQSFVKKLKFTAIANEALTKDDIKNTIAKFIPLIKTSKEGIAKIIAQKELFVEI